MSRDAIEWAAIAVPAAYFVARVFLPGRGVRDNLSWVTLAVPILVWGVVTSNPATVLGAVVVAAGPYAIDQFMDRIWRRR